MWEPKYSLYTPGNTPLVRINSLSDALDVEILGKAEVVSGSSLQATLSLTGLQFMNPGGSVKDRVALRSTILLTFFKEGYL